MKTQTRRFTVKEPHQRRGKAAYTGFPLGEDVVQGSVLVLADSEAYEYIVCSI